MQQTVALQRKRSHLTMFNFFLFNRPGDAHRSDTDLVDAEYVAHMREETVTDGWPADASALYSLPKQAGTVSTLVLHFHIAASSSEFVRDDDWMDELFASATYGLTVASPTPLYSIDGRMNMTLLRLYGVIPDATPFLQWADQAFMLLRRRGVAALAAHKIVARVAVTENPYCYHAVHSAAARYAFCSTPFRLRVPLAFPPTLEPTRMLDYQAAQELRVVVHGASVPQYLSYMFSPTSADPFLSVPSGDRDEIDRPYMLSKTAEQGVWCGDHLAVPLTGTYGMSGILVYVRASYRHCVQRVHVWHRDGMDDPELFVQADAASAAVEAKRHNLPSGWFAVPVCDTGRVVWHRFDYPVRLGQGGSGSYLDAPSHAPNFSVKIHSSTTLLPSAVYVYALGRNIMRRVGGMQATAFL